MGSTRINFCGIFAITLSFVALTRPIFDSVRLRSFFVSSSDCGFFLAVIAFFRGVGSTAILTGPTKEIFVFACFPLPYFAVFIPIFRLAERLLNPQNFWSLPYYYGLCGEF